MQHVDVERRFPAPLRLVWERYTDHAHWKDWAGFTRSDIERPGSPDPNGLGCMRVFGSAGFDAWEEVVEWEPMRRFAYRVRRGGLPMKDHYGEVTFTPDGDGTVVRWRCRFDSRIPGLGWAMRLFIARFFRMALAGLARHHFPGR